MTEARAITRTLQPNAAARASAGAVGPAALVLLLGVLILFGAGFAGPQMIHNAAHDTRHTFVFPCH
jgi:cobalt transporter subunit CbtB